MWKSISSGNRARNLPSTNTTRYRLSYSASHQLYISGLKDQRRKLYSRSYCNWPNIEFYFRVMTFICRNYEFKQKVHYLVIPCKPKIKQTKKCQNSKKVTFIFDLHLWRSNIYFNKILTFNEKDVNILRNCRRNTFFYEY